MLSLQIQGYTEEIRFLRVEMARVDAYIRAGVRALTAKLMLRGLTFVMTTPF